MTQKIAAAFQLPLSLSCSLQINLMFRSPAARTYALQIYDLCSIFHDVVFFNPHLTHPAPGNDRAVAARVISSSPNIIPQPGGRTPKAVIRMDRFIYVPFHPALSMMRHLNIICPQEVRIRLGKQLPAAFSPQISQDQNAAAAGFYPITDG